MFSAPGHPFLAQLLRNAADLIERTQPDRLASKDGVYNVAGPPALRRAMAELLCSPAHRDLGASMQWWGEIGGGLPGLIKRKVDGLRKEWEDRGYAYWMSSAGRGKTPK